MEINRCTSLDPFGVARCELMAGHPGEHINGVHGRHWINETEGRKNR